MAIAIQSVANVFTAPNRTTDVVGVANISNASEPVNAEDPTATGAIWSANRILLGQTSTIGGTLPLRGPGGASPPLANAWVPGRILQSGGWAEVRYATAGGDTLQAGSTTTALKLATTESSVDDFLVGLPIQHANIGTGFRATSIVTSYEGATRMATIGETIVAPTGAYVIPAHIRYVLGTMTSTPPLLSISVWRDKKRYDYSDFRPSSLKFDVPVSNESNQSFPSCEFSGRGILVGVYDDTTPLVSDAVLAIPVAAARGGKFYMDKVKLGHQMMSFTTSFEIGAPSNQNQDAGQDGYEILSGTRTVELDINAMAVSDFDLQSRINAQTPVSIMDTWGNGAGNNWGLTLPNLVLDPLNPGDRNGFNSLTGNAMPTDVDKSAALTIWW